MIRIIIGGLVGGVVMFVIGFIFCGDAARRDPLRDGDVDDRRRRRPARAGRRTCPTGTGTYSIPGIDSAAGRPCSTARADRHGPLQHRAAFAAEDMTHDRCRA